MLKIMQLRIENRINPLGLDIPRPRFSWILESSENNTLQHQYQVKITSIKGEEWDSGVIESDRSIHVAYEGSKLRPRTRYDVTVQVWDNHGQTASVSSWFETGLISYHGFEANWITHPFGEDFEPCPVFTKAFPVEKEVKSARIYASALGVYSLVLNGQSVSDTYFAPGWTDYHHRVQYQAYDITQLLQPDNRLEMTVGKGWFCGYLGFYGTDKLYGRQPAVILQIHIDYSDGGSEVILTDESWFCTTGPRRSSEIYHGEVIDYTCEPEQEKAAQLLDYAKKVLTAQESEPVRTTRRIKPIKKLITPNGEVVLDFGQNLVGVVEARLQCIKGTKIILRHAEVLDKEGNFYTINLRAARATDTFVCSGGEDVFLPSFTFHGFRYVQVIGLGEAFDPSSFTACVMHTDMAETGHFSCSHPGINQLQSNIQWGQRSNFLDIPTDCPQRDERLGWTGDAQVFAATAAFNMDVSLFFRKWLRDLAVEQTPERGVPHIIPNVLRDGDNAAGWSKGAAAWGDAATIIPWEMYMAYGDTEALREQYPSMKMWVEHIRNRSAGNGLWQDGHQFGDWLALDKEEGPDCVGATDVYFVASAYYAYSTELTAKAAKVLGYEKDADEYAALHAHIIRAFREEYITRTGRLVSETQTGCVLALHFNLPEENHRGRILSSLIENIARHNNHLTTGFVGTPYLCHVLTENGRHDLAGKLLLKEDYPSWLYTVNMGATTMWERWNSMQEDGSIDDNGMNSFNHYAYGSIGEWMYCKLTGFQILEPGYRKIRIAPMPIDGIDWADACIHTPYGTLSCRWERKNEKIAVDVNIPANTRAEILLPGEEQTRKMGSGLYHWEVKTYKQAVYRP